MSLLTDVKSSISSLPNAVQKHTEKCTSCKDKLESITTKKALEILTEMVKVRQFRNFVQSENDKIDFSGAKYGESNWKKLGESHSIYAEMPALRETLHQKIMHLYESAKPISDHEFTNCYDIAVHSVPHLYLG